MPLTKAGSRTPMWMTTPLGFRSPCWCDCCEILVLLAEHGKCDGVAASAGSIFFQQEEAAFSHLLFFAATYTLRSPRLLSWQRQVHFYVSKFFEVLPRSEEHTSELQ